MNTLAIINYSLFCLQKRIWNFYNKNRRQVSERPACLGILWGALISISPETPRTSMRIVVLRGWSGFPLCREATANNMYSFQRKNQKENCHYNRIPFSLKEIRKKCLWASENFLSANFPNKVHTKLQNNYLGPLNYTIKLYM